MKRSAIGIWVLLTGMALVTMVSGCKGPEGPAGPAGSAGLNQEGFAPGIRCASCHNPEEDTTHFVLGRAYEWGQSLHANGGDLERNGPDCAGCHTTEGFIQRHRNGWSTQVVQPVLHPSPPGCFACHSPHSRGDFSRRDTTPVTIKSFVAGVPDAVFDYGNGNVCARCHQTRTASPMSPIPDPTKTAITDTIKITSSRWYPHYGVQAQMLMGTGGFQFVDYTYSGNSNHASNAILREEGCVKCHMAEQSYPPNAGTGKGGGHTMNIRYEWEGVPGVVLTGCKDPACHGSTLTTTDFAGPSTGGVGAQTLIQRNLDTLGALLASRNWVDTTAGTVKATSANPLRIVPASRAGAIYNYLFVEHEKSKGVHNTLYAYELLRSSIAELRKP